MVSLGIRPKVRALSVDGRSYCVPSRPLLRVLGHQTAYVKTLLGLSGEAVQGRAWNSGQFCRLQERVHDFGMADSNGGIIQDRLRLVNRLNESRSPYVSPQFVARQGRRMGQLNLRRL